MRDRRPEAHRRDPRTTTRVEQHADDPGRPLVARELEPELVDELRVGRSARHRGGPRVGHVGDECSERHRELHAELARKLGHEVAERAPAVIRLDADEQDRVAVRLGDSCAVEGVLGPLDLPRAPVFEGDHRPRRLEVDEELRVDVGELPRSPEPGQIPGRERRGLTAVVPSPERADQDRPLEGRRTLVHPELASHRSSVGTSLESPTSGSAAWPVARA